MQWECFMTLSQMKVSLTDQVEAAGRGIDTLDHAATIAKRK